MEYNAIIRQYKSKSLNILARVLVADLNDFPDNWIIRYQGETLHRRPEIQELCCNPTNPLQIYKPVENNFPIVVRTLDAQILTFIASELDTVKLLKMKIFQKNNSYPPHSQKIYFWRKNDQSELKDGEALGTYGITVGSVLYVKFKVSGLNLSQSLVKNDFEPVDFGPVPDQIPSWSFYSVGINLCGICPNENCVSKRQQENPNVIIHLLEYDTLSLDFSDKKEKRLNCPACSTNKAVRLRKAKRSPDNEKSEDLKPYAFQIVLESLVVNSANLQIQYKATNEIGVKENDDIKSKGTTTAAVGQQHEVMKLEKNLGQMELISMEPWRSPYVCVKCDTWITFKGNQCHLKCGHVYHSWCKPTILKGSQCKICASQVHMWGNMKKFLEHI